jgi:hypothetical protein
MPYRWGAREAEPAEGDLLLIETAQGLHPIEMFDRLVETLPLTTV